MGYIDPNKEIFDGFLSQSNCLKTKNGFFIKDLRIIKNRNIESMILIDHSVHSFGSLISNCIPLLSWTDNSEDKELYYLTKYLKKMSEISDVRPLNLKELKLKELLDYKF